MKLSAGTLWLLLVASAAWGCDSSTGPKTASLVVNITGLPAGVAGAVTVRGPDAGTTRTATQTQTFGELPPGSYTIVASNVEADEIYGATIQPGSLDLAASSTPVTVSVGYAAVTGSMTISPAGLPANVSGIWEVTGPGFEKTITGTSQQLITRMPSGSYTIRARVVGDQGINYVPATESVTAQVSAGAIAPVTFAYEVGAPTLDLIIDAVHLNQSVQRYDGSIPLVAGRSAFLRVFVRANETNTVSTRVRVQILRNGVEISERLIAAPRPGIERTVDPTVEARSWNLLLSGAEIAPGTSLRVDVDPDGEVTEVNEANNGFPLDGSLLNLDIRTVPRLDVRLVSVVTAVNGLAGDASLNRADNLLDMTLRMFPLLDYTADTRPPYTTSAALLEPQNGNGSWSTILSELNAVRVADGSLRYYVGMLKVPYSSGFHGYGYIGGRTSVNGDYAGSSQLIAHELGHNFRRFHSPCGGPASPDMSYPHADGAIGVVGYDLITKTLKSPALKDLMSYCSPAWISDYSYAGVLDYRSSLQFSLGASVQSLIVWGRVEGRRLVLEPAFVIDAPAQLPRSRGEYSIEARASDGSKLFELSFDPEEVGEDRESRHFAFAVPLTSVALERLATLRLNGEGATQTVTAQAAAFPAGIASIKRAGPEDVLITWDFRRHPMLVVRDPDSGHIISLARGGKITVRTRKAMLDVVATDNVRSTKLRVPVRD